MAMLLLFAGIVISLGRLLIPSINLWTYMAVLLIIPAWYDGRIRSYCRRQPIISSIVLVAASVGFAYYLMGNNLKAQWSAIDDHEIMHFLGSDGVIHLSEVPSVLRSTEVGNPGSPDLPRYRPSYYAVRILETWFWGANPNLWHLCRMMILATTLGLFFYFFMRLLGLTVAIVFVMYLMTYPFWADIWCRLGPSEAYAAFGLGLFLVGAVVLLRGGPPAKARRLEIPAWVLLTAGAVLGIGSKENFLVLVPATWAIAGHLWRKGRLNLAGLGCAALITCCGALVACSVALSLARKGSNVYNQSAIPASLSSMVQHGFISFLSPFSTWDSTFAAIIFAVAVWFGARRRIWMHRSRLVWALVLLAGLVLLYLFNFIFYGGNWPVQPGQPHDMTRYNFPGLLAKPLAMLVIGMMILNVLRVSGIQLKWLRLLYGAIPVALGLLVLNHGFGPIRRTSAGYALVTTIWTEQQLLPVIRKLNEAPNRPVVFCGYGSAGVIEPIISARRYFTAMGVKNPSFVQMQTDNNNHPLSIAMATKLAGISQNGGQGFLPLEQLKTEAKPLAIGFSMIPPATYEFAGILWPPLTSLSQKERERIAAYLQPHSQVQR
jgi:uncharacterized membrane protein YozB (DUF420 family)